MSTLYAKGTLVSISQTEHEIRSLLLKYGATSFATGFHGARAQVVFEVRGIRIRFELPLPKTEDPMFDVPPRSSKESQTLVAREKRRDAEHRARWRALALVIKAKLEAVNSGITTFEHEFLAHVVTAAGSTIGDQLVPKLAQHAASAKLPPLLGAGS